MNILTQTHIHTHTAYHHHMFDGGLILSGLFVSVSMIAAAQDSFIINIEDRDSPILNTQVMECLHREVLCWVINNTPNKRIIYLYDLLNSLSVVLWRSLLNDLFFLD